MSCLAVRAYAEEDERSILEPHGHAGQACVERVRHATQMILGPGFRHDSQARALRIARDDAWDSLDRLAEEARIETGKEKRRGGRVSRHLLGGAGGDDPALRQQGGLRAALRLGQVVCADDNARSRRREASDASPYVLPGERIETGRWLVVEEQAARMDQRGRQLGPTGPAAREPARRGPRM